jgi:hypothetical protein
MVYLLKMVIFHGYVSSLCMDHFPKPKISVEFSSASKFQKKRFDQSTRHND